MRSTNRPLMCSHQTLFQQTSSQVHPGQQIFPDAASFTTTSWAYRNAFSCLYPPQPSVRTKLPGSKVSRNAWERLQAILHGGAGRVKWIAVFVSLAHTDVRFS